MREETMGLCRALGRCQWGSAQRCSERSRMALVPQLSHFSLLSGEGVSTKITPLLKHFLLWKSLYPQNTSFLLPVSQTCSLPPLRKRKWSDRHLPSPCLGYLSDITAFLCRSSCLFCEQHWTSAMCQALCWRQGEGDKWIVIRFNHAFLFSDVLTSGLTDPILKRLL